MLVAFQAADELLKGNPEDFDQTTFDLWFDLQMEGLAAAHYWRDEPEQVEAVLEKVRPVLRGAGRAPPTAVVRERRRPLAGDQISSRP